MGQRVENPQLKPYVYSLATQKLEACELFVKVFGKDFAKRRLDLNFSKLYTNEERRNVAGYYSTSDLSITFCKKGKDGLLLSIQEFQEDKDLQCISLHETIHAILDRLKSECKKFGIVSGTGFLEHYANGTELGRGLNEGYTNWVCEKAGMTTNSYAILTNFVKMLELAIGPEDIMKMGYGDITNNISKLLKMTPEECKVFLGLADQIYTLEDKHHDISRIVTLTSFSREPESKLDELNEISVFADVEQNPDYISFTESKELDPSSLGSKIAYFKDLDNKYIERILSVKRDFENALYIKYFQKEFENITKSPEITEEQYKKFMKISYFLSDYSENVNTPANRFQKEFEAIKERFFAQTLEKIKQEIKSGDFTIAKYKRYRDTILSDMPNNYFEKMQYELQVSKIMCPENPEIYAEFLRKLDEKKKLEEISDYIIIELETDTGKKESLFIDKKGKDNFSSRSYGTKKFLAKDEIENTKELFDFTLDDLTSIQAIVSEFLKLKEDIKRRNPEAEFEIINDIIVVSTKVTSLYFIIEGNSIKIANAKKIDKNEFAPEKEEKPAIINSKKNPISEFLLSIKRKLLRQKTARIYESPEESRKMPSWNSEKEDFDKRIRDMSNYSTIDERTENSELTKNLNQKDDFCK